MTGTPLPQQLADLLEQFCLGELTVAGASQLEQLVTSDPNNLRHYLRFVQMHAIALRFEGVRPNRDEALVPSAPAVPPPPARQTDKASRVQGAALPLDRGSWIRRLALAHVAAIAVSAGLVGYFVALVVLLNNPRKDSRPAPMAAATLIQSEQVCWSDDARPAEHEDTIRTGQLLKITSGVVELELHQGATIFVEGPAEWSIDGVNSATLNQGKLVAVVPQQAVGFQVHTPNAIVVDLGTEFGVEVDSTGATEVHVLRGEVETTPRIADRPAAPRSIRLSAGEALRIQGAASATSRLMANHSRFHSRKQRKAADATSPASYQQMILADRPLAYWPLNEAAGATTVADLSGNGHVGTVHGDVRFGVLGPAGLAQSTAAQFDGNGWLEIADSEPLSLSKNFTVEVWIRPALYELTSRIISVETADAKAGWALGIDPLVKPGADRRGPLFTLFESSKDFHFASSGVTVAPDVWRHLVLVCDKDVNAHLFLDGVWVAALKGPQPGILGAVRATIGRRPNSRHPYFGSLAHLALYPTTLDQWQFQRRLRQASDAASASHDKRRQVQSNR